MNLHCLLSLRDPTLARIGLELFSGSVWQIRLIPLLLDCLLSLLPIPSSPLQTDEIRDQPLAG